MRSLKKFTTTAIPLFDPHQDPDLDFMAEGGASAGPRPPRVKPPAPASTMNPIKATNGPPAPGAATPALPAPPTGFQQPGVPNTPSGLPGMPGTQPAAPSFQPAPAVFDGTVPDMEQLGGKERDMGHVVADAFPTNPNSAESINAKEDAVAPISGAPGSGSGPGGKVTIMQIMDGFVNMAKRKELREQAKWARDMGNTDVQKVVNPENPFGDYTLNAGIGNNFQPGNQTPTQRRYELGGEYEMEDDEIRRLQALGYRIHVTRK